MTTYVALLRGVNLGSYNKVPMAELRQSLGEGGLDDVRTYIQSGNVVFRSTAGAVQLETTIENVIAQRFGLDVRVLVRTDAELVAVLAGNPFAAAQPDQTKLHVVFLSEAPDPARVAALEATHDGAEAFAVSGRDVYLLTPDGLGRASLTHASFEKAFGLAATARNWRTVNRLAEMAAGG